MRTKIQLLALIAALLLALSACGGTQSAPAETPSDTASESADAAPAEAETEPAEPVTEPVEAVTEPAEAETESAEPVTEPVEAVTEPAAPAEGPDDAPQSAEGPDDAPQSADAAGSQDPGDPLAYTVSTNREGDTEYIFDVLLVTVPGDWEGKYKVVRTGDTWVSFYHIGSYDAFEEKYGFVGGHLFSISVVDRGVDPDYPSEQYLGLARDGKDYYMVFPTDVQGFYEDEDIYQEWTEMNAEMDVVTENSYSMLFHD